MQVNFRTQTRDNASLGSMTCAKCRFVLCHENLDRIGPACQAGANPTWKIPFRGERDIVNGPDDQNGSRMLKPSIEKYFYLPDTADRIILVY